MQAITTKFLYATKTKGPRIKATSEFGQSITIDFDYCLDKNALHAKAAFALIKKLGWDTKKIISGSISQGYVFCLGESEAFTI